MNGSLVFPSNRCRSGPGAVIGSRPSQNPHLVLMLALVVMLSACWSALSADGRRIDTTNNQDYFGFDLRSEQDISLEQCKSVCLADGQCRAFTYNTKARWCFLKSDFGRSTFFEGAVSGKVVTVSSDPDIGAPAALGFLPAGFQREAADMRTRLAAPENEAGLFRLAEAARRQITAGNYQPAVVNLRSALGFEPDRIALWLDLARASELQLRTSGDTDYAMQRLATAAAVNAYDLSRTAVDRAEALELLARTLELREQFRAALEAYKASLALVDSPRVLADFRDLKARKGFRVVEHTVDADGRTGRICLRFSDPLVRSGVDYSTFVTVDGRSVESVQATGSELCTDGLDHGRSYRISLRAGLPAAVGEVLERPVAVNAYVRDRSSSVRFTGDNFVLPNSVRHGIPVVSVNATAVDITVYRVGERSLTALLAESRFLRQLDNWDSHTIEDRLGEQVWQGKLDVKSELNAEAVTSFPIDEALPDRKPGVYAMTATIKGVSGDSWAGKATQWFVVSDIGLSTFTGADGLHVFARSLATARPEAGTKLTLLARNNEVLGEAVTDENGRASFKPGLVRGTEGLAPAVLTAGNDDGDFVFLDLTRAGFDLSDRGVTGRPSPGPLDLFAWTERGIYRAGETVHLAALARDDSADAISALPLTFIVSRPDGKEVRRIVETGGAAGGYQIALPLPANAMHGTWTVSVHADPDGPALSDRMFLVEDFRPDRTEFDLDVPDKPLVTGVSSDVLVDGRYLYGAPAAGLALEADLRLKTVRERDGYTGYVFGLAEEEAVSSQVALAPPAPLDAEGRGSVAVEIDTLPSTTRPLVAEINVRMREDGGRTVERNATLQVKPQATMIGIQPLFDEGQVAENTQAGFAIAAVDAEGRQIAWQGLNWSLKRIERNYQWYTAGGSWRYEPVEFTREIEDGTVDTAADQPGSVSVPVGWGRYRLDVVSDDPDGPMSSFEFTAGWYVSASSTETPDGLEIALDGESYRPGDTARLNITPRHAGTALITVANDRMREVLSVAVPDGGTVVDIPVKEGWGAGAYVTATLFRPGEDATSRLPSRAIGIKWIEVDPGDRVVGISLDIPDKVEPDQALQVPVSLTGLKPGETGRFTLAAVDVGILNLTAYKAPDPESWYFGQRQFGMEIRDLFGRLIDGSLGVAGAIRSGGDGGGMVQQGSPPKQKLVSLFSGIVEAGPDGQAMVTFDIPQFNGTLRLMAVAWTARGVGRAEKDLVVRDPVVITTSMPKFLAPDDVSEIRIDLANTDGPAGDYRVTLDTGVAVTAEPVDFPETVTLDEGGRATLTASLKGIRPGTSEIVVRLVGPGGLDLVHVDRLDVRPGVLPVVTRYELPLAANGGSAVIDSELLAASYLEGAAVSVDISNSQFDVPALLMSLDRYPYGCAEQTTSRAMPLLYLSGLDAPASLLEDNGLKARIDGAIARVLSYQSAEGSFGLWGPGGGDLWLDAYVSDFLTRAHENGHEVPAQALRLAIDNLQNTLSYTNDVEDDGDAIAYALYVLARNKRASAGDLRYYADVRLAEFSSAMARAQIAAALSLYGDTERARRSFDSAYVLAAGERTWNAYRPNYGSPLRNDAAMLALAGESRPVPPMLDDMVRLVADGQKAKPAQSTQEQAWMLLAARAVQDSNTELSLAVNGIALSGSYRDEIDGDELQVNPVRVVNTGDEPVNAIVTSVAAPIEPPKAGGEGFAISRDYYDLEGNPVSIERVAQNERFVVVINVTKLSELPAQLVVTDLLPAGLEIDNPRLVDSAQLAGFSWLGDTNAAYSEFRDDRFVAAFDTGSSTTTVRMAYVVRAVTPGLYTHPSAQVEDMYRPQYSARTATRWMEVRPATQ